MMKPFSCTRVGNHSRFLLVLFAASTLSFGSPGYAQDDSEHDMAGMSHDGELSADTIQELRTIITTIADLSDDEIRAMMKMMPPNYEQYLSDENHRSDVGVIIAVHGFGEVGDKIFAESLAGVSKSYPTAIGFGMAMMTSSHFQSSADDLSAAGASTIVVVPATQSEHDTGFRQYNYIFGAIDEAAYLAVPQVETAARVIITPPISDHPLISEILLDHAREISTDEQNEVVIILGHGPQDDEDNARELEELATHAQRVKSMSQFADVKSINLQDDAAKEIRDANVKKLREMAQSAMDQDYDVLIVGYLIGTAGIQHKIENDLAGIELKFNERGMSEHPNFAKWVDAMVQDALVEN